MSYLGVNSVCFLTTVCDSPRLAVSSRGLAEILALDLASVTLLAGSGVTGTEKVKSKRLSTKITTRGSSNNSNSSNSRGKSSNSSNSNSNELQDCRLAFFSRYAPVTLSHKEPKPFLRTAEAVFQ